MQHHKHKSPLNYESNIHFNGICRNIRHKEEYYSGGRRYGITDVIPPPFSAGLWQTSDTIKAYDSHQTQTDVADTRLETPRGWSRITSGSSLVLGRASVSADPADLTPSWRRCPRIDISASHEHQTFRRTAIAAPGWGRPAEKMTETCV